MSFVLSVNEHVARNPVARSIERARLAKHRAEVLAEIRALKTWEHCPSLIHGVAEALAIAIKTIEGWDDPEGIQAELLRALDTLRELSEAGFVWKQAHADHVCAAFDAAMQIISAQDPRAKVKAWVWTQAIEHRIRQEAAAA